MGFLDGYNVIKIKGFPFSTFQMAKEIENLRGKKYK